MVQQGWRSIVCIPPARHRPRAILKQAESQLYNHCRKIAGWEQVPGKLAVTATLTVAVTITVTATVPITVPATLMATLTVRVDLSAMVIVLFVCRPWLQSPWQQCGAQPYDAWEQCWKRSTLCLPVMPSSSMSETRLLALL